MRRRSLTRLAGLSFGLCLLGQVFAAAPVKAQQDPAVQFMERVSKDLMAAQRTRSVQAMQLAIGRYGDVQSASAHGCLVVTLAKII